MLVLAGGFTTPARLTVGNPTSCKNHFSILTFPFPLPLEVLLAQSIYIPLESDCIYWAAHPCSLQWLYSNHAGLRWSYCAWSAQRTQAQSLKGPLHHRTRMLKLNTWDVLRAIQICAWPMEQMYLLFPGYVFSVGPNRPQFSDPLAVPVLQYNKRRQMFQFSVSLPEEIQITS